MTLKTRLTAMMVVLLLAVMALQYILAERQQRELVDRLAEVTSGVEESTRKLSEWTRHQSGGSSPGDSLAGVVAHHENVGTLTQVFIAGGDTTIWVEPLPGSGADSMVVVGFARDTHEMDFFSELPESLAGEGFAELVIEIQDFDGQVRRRFERGHVTRSMGKEDLSALAVTLPFFAQEHDDPMFIRMSYPLDEITTEIAAARRSSLLWLSALVGVGVLGAGAMAVQFTKPIRALQQSFQRVEAGDLTVRLHPERNDEVGKLTSSFNQMVERLQETKAIETRLVEAERLASLGNLAAGVAHEVRNPLNAILLTLQQMRDKTETHLQAEDRRVFDRHYQRVTGELGRLDQLVGTILDLAGNKPLTPEPVDLTEQLRTGASLFEPQSTEQGVTLHVASGDGPVVYADPVRLSTVWNNLLSNAVEATPRGGTVTLAARSVPGGAEITVTDEGSGISADNLTRIWEPFFTGRAEGTGLGLSLVRAVVEAHGGTVTATSEPGNGSRFTVTLPSEPPRDVSA